ncbi:hypothetical protein KC343_g14294 [Hortaea werneckii]|uniref:EGF domain-specific O-linked N-acetylglucosamine transferase n=1 Tax=Hortaea werneckii TaxID=91943 RepID=A0A3M7DSY9_HORWE|nr:hypothetical protein KC352_g17770 [Hortaea werneckii]KAI7560644.1 hypothetical protein KC317_g9592 [Hortaea werneckii]KAI7598795.1 hypothetical protein KC346_g14064 [Hortaea werneckii]KAI7603961.1 hypothetical protein KC343_g14294 [Hortaea werneckii]KAI7640785.1 hypothetical protein KC319_g13812 [Hortaea werneckii]
MAVTLLLPRKGWRSMHDSAIQMTSDIWHFHNRGNSAAGIQENSSRCNRFDDAYIRGFTERFAEYCDATSPASLTCFSHQAFNLRLDTFCVGTPAEFNRKVDQAKPISLTCRLRKEYDLPNGIPLLRDLPNYGWFDTGAFKVFEEFLSVDESTEPLSLHDDSNSTSSSKESGRGYSFLIKREWDHNMWHELLQIFSLYNSVEVLRKSIDPKTGEPFFTEEDARLSKLVILDDIERGPYFDPWTADTGLPPVKMKNVLSGSETTPKSVLVPLVGIANPLWQGDWQRLPCGESALLHKLVQKVLSFYDIPSSSQAPHRPQRLVMIDRMHSRHLLHVTALFEALQARHPEIKMTLLDYGTLDFKAQLETDQTTDILVGVHGAGLTHGMFLPPRSTMAQILPPTLDHYGFENMARFLGHKYYSTHTKAFESVNHTGDWHHDDVFIEEEDFLKFMDEVITGASA